MNFMFRQWFIFKNKQLKCKFWDMRNMPLPNHIDWLTRYTSWVHSWAQGYNKSILLTSITMKVASWWIDVWSYFSRKSWLNGRTILMLNQCHCDVFLPTHAYKWAHTHFLWEKKKSKAFISICPLILQQFAVVVAKPALQLPSFTLESFGWKSKKWHNGDVNFVAGHTIVHI